MPVQHLADKLNMLYVTVDPLAELDVFTDGLWHSVYVDIEAGGENRVGLINITVDGRVDISNRQLTFTTTSRFYIGGDYCLLRFQLDIFYLLI